MQIHIPNVSFVFACKNKHFPLAGGKQMNLKAAKITINEDCTAW